MKSPISVALLFLLTVATATRLSVAAAARGESGGGIAGTVGRELRALVAGASNVFRSAAGVWHTASGGDGSVAEAKNLRAAAASRRRRPPKSAGASCVTAAMCRKRRVVCGKRCNNGASRAASVTHVAPKCVVKCKKCVPTC